MSLWAFARYAVGALCAAGLLAACGGGTPSNGAVPGAQSPASSRGFPNASMITVPNSIGAVPVRHLNRGRSWIRPDAHKQWLLYVSDASTGTIDIYNYRVQAGKLYGQITGLSFPYGQCVDRDGDVYVVDNDTSKIYEYAHGGTTPIATATDKYGKPVGCSVDPTSGNVAVSNFSGASSSTAGGLDLFTGGLSGSQVYYRKAELYRVFPGAYDPSGDFFAQGIDYSGTVNFAELPAGKKRFRMLTGLTIAFPGSVQWDGHYLAVTDQDYQYAYTTMIYRVTVSGSKVTVVRSTHLTDNCYPYHDYMVAIQPFVTGTTGKQNAVAAGNLNCPNSFGFWNYTNGGNPKRTLPSSIAPGAPYGQSVSPPSTGG